MFRSLFRLPAVSSAVFRPTTAARFASNGNHCFEKLEFKKGTGTASSEDFRDKAVLVFFSAGWCPSCKEFTPYLKEFYENAKSEGLQVVWVSRDRSEEDQTEYYEKNLPADWPYIPFGTKEIRDFLKLYKIQTIPSVKLVTSEGEVADDGARVKIEKNYSDAEAAKKIVAEWRKKVGLESK